MPMPPRVLTHGEVDAWSTDGAQLLVSKDPGSWCAVSHTSIFAIAQKIPFGNALPTELAVKENSSWD